jgi:UDP-glucose 4-epimerase
LATVVFGAAGFVGRNVVAKLRNEGWELIASDFVDSPFDDEVDYRKVDLLDREAVESVVKDASKIIHLAASPLVVSLKKPVENMKVNVEGTLNIMNAAKEFSIDKMIFSSASSVVGDVEYSPVDESHPCTPKTPYAVAKYTIENYLRVYGDIYGLRHVIFRFFNVYGPHQLPETGGLIPMIYKRLTSGQEFAIFGDGSATRDFVYVEDVADIILAALKAETNNELLNLGTGIPATILEAVNTSGEILGVQPNLKYEPQRPGEIANFVADTTKLEETLGSVPTTTLDDGLRKTFDWLKGNESHSD